MEEIDICNRCFKPLHIAWVNLRDLEFKDAKICLECNILYKKDLVKAEWITWELAEKE